MCGKSVNCIMRQAFSGHLKEVKSEAKKNFCNINVDRTATQSLQMKIFPHFFLCFGASLLAWCPL